MICNYLKRLDSGFRRNDGEGGCCTFYECIKVNVLKIFSPTLTILTVEPLNPEP
jgi:hypothetical protein